MFFWGDWASDSLRRTRDKTGSALFGFYSSSFYLIRQVFCTWVNSLNSRDGYECGCGGSAQLAESGVIQFDLLWHVRIVSYIWWVFKSLQPHPSQKKEKIKSCWTVRVKWYLKWCSLFCSNVHKKIHELQWEEVDVLTKVEAHFFTGQKIYELRLVGTLWGRPTGLSHDRRLF